MTNIYTSSEESNILSTPEFNLWIDVIRQAVDDIVLIDILIEEGKEVKEEYHEYRQSAHDFLFNDSHLIIFDDYKISYLCSDCFKNVSTKMSEFINVSICPNCGKQNSIISTSYEIEKISKEISLKELFSIFNIENINNFRESLEERIEFLKEKKRIKRKKQRAYQLKKKGLLVNGIKN